MNRISIIRAAVLALTLTSCQQKEISDSDDGNAVHFMNAATRAPITDLSAMMNDSRGFMVYATDPGSSTNWYDGIDGSATYRYSGSEWEWTSGAPQWPAMAAGYPMNFYAYFPVNTPGFTLVDAMPGQLIASVEVAASPAMQTDLLAASATATTKPASGKLTLAFTHILSKIDFGVIAGSGMQVQVQSLTANNLKDEGLYDYRSGTWTSPSGKSSYLFFGSYFPAGTGGTQPIDPFEPPVADNVTANPFYTPPHGKYLMLMPQTSLNWEKTSPPDDAYIGVIYRIERADDPDYIGYRTAATHPDYTPGSAYTGPLLVKVGFPFAAGNLVWDKARGYTYNLLLGTPGASGGYYTDVYYYDENGNRTSYPVPGKQIGDAVQDGSINFNMSITDWIVQSSAPLNPQL